MAKKKSVAKAVKTPAKSRAARANQVKPMSCLDAAAAVLKAKGEPMRCKEMVAAMVEKGLWKSDAPTPHATLFSALLREINSRGTASRFRKVDRGMFAIAER